jgi:DmsE family decaheme c-type cytochrome
MFRPPRNTSMVRAFFPERRALRPPLRYVLLMAALFSSATLWGAQQQAGAPAPPPADNKPAEYVGSETCQACHEDIFNAFKKSPHEVVETDKHRGFDTKACESCHGPGSKHAESVSATDIRNPAKLKPAEADKVCLTCHLNEPTHVGRITSSHAKNQVSCVACHSVHKNGPNGLVVRKAAEINQQCSQCHSSVWASFQRPYKHRLPEGAMSCVDCHNPHGTFLPRSIQTTAANEPGCFKCHGDKRGPFVYEHPPVKMEGCATCHEPHGSANPRMLTRPVVQTMCLECHSNLPLPTTPTNANLGGVPPAIHDLRSPRFQNCTNCHQKVHGSNVSRDLFK